MTLEKGSLVLLDYIAKVKDTSEVFETTREEEAKKTDHYDPTRKYEPRLVSVGESWVLRGLDEALASANVGDNLNIEISPDKGFGERVPSKVRMIPQRKLGDKADEVGVGDTVEIDERTGTVKYIGSGRVQVDFNHRLAGRTLVYDVKIVKKLDSDPDKIKALMRRRLPLEEEKTKFNLSGSELEIELPEESYLVDGLQIIKRAIANDVFKFVISVKVIKFSENYSAPTPAPAQILSSTPTQASKPTDEQELPKTEKPVEPSQKAA